MPTEERITIGLTKTEKKLAEKVRKKQKKSLARIFVEHITDLSERW